MSIIYANQIKYQKSRQRLLLPADVPSVMRTNRGVNMDHGHFIQDLMGANADQHHNGSATWLSQ